MKIKARSFFLYCLACIILIASASGCSPSKKSLLDYQDVGIEAELYGRINEVDFTASLTLQESDGSGDRPFKLTLLSPKTLQGIVFSRDENGKLAVDCGDVTLDLPTTAMGAVMIADLFSISESPTKISTVSGANESLAEYEKLTRIEFPSATVFLAPDTSTPVKLVSDGVQIFVTSFRRLNKETQPAQQ